MARLDLPSLRLPVGEDWTVATALLHLAFWDRFVAERWRHSARISSSTPSPIQDHVTDLVNEALTPLLRTIAVENAASEAVEAAHEVDQLISALPEATIEAVRQEGRPALVDRSLHRHGHLDEIYGALADHGDRGAA